MGRKEMLLYSGGWQPGEKADSIKKPTPKILMDHGSFQREKGKLIILREGQRLHYLLLCPDFLLIGWWWGTASGILFSSKLAILHKGGGLNFCRRIQCISLEEEPGPCPIDALLSPDCFSFVSAFPPFYTKVMGEIWKPSSPPANCWNKDSTV